MRALLMLAAMLAWRTADASPEPVDESYQGSTVVVSVVSVSIGAIGLGTSSPTLVAIGGVGFVVGAPLMHMARERPGRAAASAGMRVALPLIGLVAAESLPRDCGAHPCGSISPAVYVGLGAGVVAATVLDAVFLAKEDAPAKMTAVAAPTRDGFSFGVAGTF